MSAPSRLFDPSDETILTPAQEDNLKELDHLCFRVLTLVFKGYLEEVQEQAQLTVLEQERRAELKRRVQTRVALREKTRKPLEGRALQEALLIDPTSLDVAPTFIWHTSALQSGQSTREFASPEEIANKQSKKRKKPVRDNSLVRDGGKRKRNPVKREDPQDRLNHDKLMEYYRQQKAKEEKSAADFLKTLLPASDNAEALSKPSSSKSENADGDQSTSTAPPPPKKINEALENYRRKYW